MVYDGVSSKMIEIFGLLKVMLRSSTDHDSTAGGGGVDVGWILVAVVGIVTSVTDVGRAMILCRRGMVWVQRSNVNDLYHVLLNY
jgi:hypothetical protein